MRRSAAWLGLAVALALALPALPTTAFPLSSQPYAATAPFAGGIDGMAGSTILSGRLNATLAPAHGPFVAFNATGFAVTGLTRVCWTGAVLPECRDSPGGQLALALADGGSLGMQFPGDAAAAVSSRHSIALFVDVGQDIEFERFRVRLGRDLAAVHVEGQVAMPSLPAMPATALQDMAAENAAGLVLLDARSRLAVRDQGQVLHTLSSDQAVVTFQGAPRVAPFGAEATLVPFAPGSAAALAPADAEAAARGVDLGRVDAMARDLQDAFGEKGAGGVGDVLDPGLQSALGPILGGALLRLPGPAAAGAGAGGDIGALVGNLTLLRFDALAATATPNGTVALSGGGPLQIQSGRVVGAPSLLGVLPWWCWLLWVAAIGLWVARLAVRPAKENARWDRLRWVGWLAAPLASLLVFWLWDGQVQQLLGVSLLRGGAGGGAVVGVLVVVELLIGLVVYLAAVVPMSSLLKSGARFAGQGRLMGLHRPVALLLGYVLGTTLLLSYIDFIISLVR